MLVVIACDGRCKAKTRKTIRMSKFKQIVKIFTQLNLVKKHFETGIVHIKNRKIMAEN